MDTDFDLSDTLTSLDWHLAVLATTDPSRGPGGALRAFLAHLDGPAKAALGGNRPEAAAVAHQEHESVKPDVHAVVRLPPEAAEGNLDRSELCRTLAARWESRHESARFEPCAPCQSAARRVAQRALAPGAVLHITSGAEYALDLDLDLDFPTLSPRARP